MIIRDGLVFDAEQVRFVRRDVRTEGARIAQLEEGLVPAEGEEVVDASSLYVIPGLVDVHVHGCHNKDFCDADLSSLADFAAYEASEGVTTICPTTMTVPKEQLLQAAGVLRQYVEETAAKPAAHRAEANIAGINMEGPFISPEKKGSQEPKNILPPDADFVRQMQEVSGGRIALVDFAPEREGSEEFIRQLRDEVTLSVAHSVADYDTALHAFRAGVPHVTHLHNAMTPFDHRAPGIVGAAMDAEGVIAELIVDGMHNHPSVVRATLRMFGRDRVAFVSDSMRATGMPDGDNYELGGHRVIVRGRKALLEDGTIAASVTNLFDAMLTAVQQMEIPLETAVLCASTNPARSIGAEECCGSISVGKRADLVLLDQGSLARRGVILRGERIC